MLGIFAVAVLHDVGENQKRLKGVEDAYVSRESADCAWHDIEPYLGILPAVQEDMEPVVGVLLPVHLIACMTSLDILSGYYEPGGSLGHIFDLQLCVLFPTAQRS